LLEIRRSSSEPDRFIILIYCIAIEFALTLDDMNLRAAVKNSLMFEGRPRHQPAYVEIVFDNTSRRFPVTEEICGAFRSLLLSVD